jgi:hypothetical protein
MPPGDMYSRNDGGSSGTRHCGDRGVASDELSFAYG